MVEQHRVTNGLNEWNRLPSGYAQLGWWDKIQANDVQRLGQERFAEYPAKGALIGYYVGAGHWYRKELNPGDQKPKPAPSKKGYDPATIERVAKAMALKSGWLGWDTATSCSDTPNGCEPDEERGHWRDLALAALDAIAPPAGT